MTAELTLEPEEHQLDAALVERLEGTQFFQALYLISLLHPHMHNMGPGHDPEGEILRFRATRSLSFGPSDVSSIEYDEQNDRFDIRVNFFGLYGPASPLPPFITERIIERDEHPSSVEDLMDLFNHRFITLLNDIWRKSRHFVRFEGHGLDATSQCLLALCGFPVDDRDKLGSVERTAILPHVGLMAHYANSPDAISSMLTSFFGIAFEIIEFVPRLVDIPENARMELGISNSLLGGDLILGEEVEDDLGKFRLRLGPAPFDVLCEFLPHGEQHTTLVELLSMIVRDPIDWDLEFQYEPDTMRAGQLGLSRLGNNIWISDGENGSLENKVHLAPASSDSSVSDEIQVVLDISGIGTQFGESPISDNSSPGRMQV